MNFFRVRYFVVKMIVFLLLIWRTFFQQKYRIFIIILMYDKIHWYSIVCLISWITSKIVNECQLKTNLSDKVYSFSYPIVNFRLDSEWYYSQLIGYLRASSFCHNFLDKGLLITRKLLNQVSKVWNWNYHFVNCTDAVTSWLTFVGDFIQICSNYWNFNLVHFFSNVTYRTFDLFPGYYVHEQHDLTIIRATACLLVFLFRF